jgi:hypothetical protein
MTSNKHSQVVVQLLAAPGYILLFLMLMFPMVLELLYVKAVLFAIELSVVVSVTFMRMRLRLHPSFLKWILFYAAIGLIFAFKGNVAGAPGAMKGAQVYVLWPAVYVVLISGMNNWRILIGAQRVLISATICISGYLLIYVLVQADVLPSFIYREIFYQRQAFYLQPGYIQASIDALHTMSFLVPFSMAALLVHLPGDRSLPISRGWLWIASSLSLGAMLVSGRRALWLVALMTPFLTFVFQSFLPKSERKGIWRFEAKIIIATILIAIGIIYYFNTIYDYKFTGLVDAFLEGFNFSNPASINTSTRRDQYFILSQAWHDNFLLGTGLGASVPGYIQSIELPWVYELYYLSLLYQVGLFGFGCYLAGIAWLYWKGIKIVRAGGAFARTTLPNLVGMTCYLAAAGTNPFLARFDGIWAIFLPLALINYSLTNREKSLPGRT